jgi:hypothetical protein
MYVQSMYMKCITNLILDLALVVIANKFPVKCADRVTFIAWLTNGWFRHVIAVVALTEKATDRTMANRRTLSHKNPALVKLRN